MKRLRDKNHLRNLLDSRLDSKEVLNPMGMCSAYTSVFEEAIIKLKKTVEGICF